MAPMAFLHRARRPGLPDGWEAILEARSAQWRLLDQPERERLGGLADWFLRTKRMEPARGFELTDEVRTVLAAHASLLLLGLDESWYDAVGTIVVRSGSMTQRMASAGPIAGTVNDSPMDVDGEAHHGDGPLMVSWRAARREAGHMRAGRDVVFHEFAHKIDMLDGVLDGTPHLAGDAAIARWVEVCTRHYDAIRAGTAGRLLREYGGTNPGEFFSVVTEAFFTRGVELADQKPDLYEVFAAFYRQDPAERVRRHLARVAVDNPAAAAAAGRPRIVVRYAKPSAN
jgi:MtfA peptidase